MSVSLTGCNEDKITSVLEQQGYSNIVLDGFSLRCGKEDVIPMSQNFEAYNKNSDTFVSGTVCCGFLKGCTIRY